MFPFVRAARFHIYRLIIRKTSCCLVPGSRTRASGEYSITGPSKPIQMHYFNDKVSREKHKTITSGLRISGMALSNKSDSPAFFSPQKVNKKIGLIPEDDLQRTAKSRRMTYQEWPNPGRWLSEIGQIPAYDKQESEKRNWWNHQSKVIFRGWAVLACRKPEMIGIFKLTFPRLKNAGKSLWLDKAIPGILTALNGFMFLSWDCIIQFF